jgi:hypothetical protein
MSVQSSNALSKKFAPDAAADGDRGLLVSAKKSGKNLQQQ